MRCIAHRGGDRGACRGRFCLRECGGEFLAQCRRRGGVGDDGGDLRKNFFRTRTEERTRGGGARVRIRRGAERDLRERGIEAGELQRADDVRGGLHPARCALRLGEPELRQFRLETRDGEPRVGAAGVAIGDFHEACDRRRALRLKLAQIPLDALRHVVARRRGLAEHSTAERVAQADEVFSARRFAGRTIVAAEEKAERARPCESR